MRCSLGMWWRALVISLIWAWQYVKILERAPETLKPMIPISILFKCKENDERFLSFSIKLLLRGNIEHDPWFFIIKSLDHYLTHQKLHHGITSSDDWCMIWMSSCTISLCNSHFFLTRMSLSWCWLL